GLAIIGWLVWWQKVTNLAPASLESLVGRPQFVNLNDLDRLAKSLAQSLQGGQVIALQGDLGAGKTTLAQGIIKHLGVTKKVTSPTYTIERQYTTQHGQTIYHHDWYRLTEGEELDYLDLQGKIADTSAIIL